MKIFTASILLAITLAMTVQPKTVVTRVLVPDTTIRKDTIVTIDTLIITSSYKDTSIFIKNDTVRAKTKKITGKR